MRYLSSYRHSGVYHGVQLFTNLLWKPHGSPQCELCCPPTLRRQVWTAGIGNRANAGRTLWSWVKQSFLPQDPERVDPKDDQFYPWGQNAAPVPPTAPKKEYQKSAHGKTWSDPYHWLSDINDPEVRSHLDRENTYAKLMLPHNKSFKKMVKELSSRLPATEVTPPERWGDWWYFTRVPEGEEYVVYYRCKLNGASSILVRAEDMLDAAAGVAAEILLYQNSLARQYGFAHVAMCKLSKDHSHMAYLLDSTGTENFNLYIKYLGHGEALSRAGGRGAMAATEPGFILEKHIIPNVGSVEWEGNESFLYTVCDSLHRPYRVYRRRLAQPAGEGDELLFQEDDPGCFVALGSSKDMRLVTINSNSRTSSEVFIVDTLFPGRGMTLVAARGKGVEYFVEHHGGFLYILTNAASSARSSATTSASTSASNSNSASASPIPRATDSASDSASASASTRASASASVSASASASANPSVKSSARASDSTSASGSGSGSASASASPSASTSAASGRNMEQVQELRVMRTPVETPSREFWEEAIPAEAGAPIEDLSMFRTHAVVHRRRDALPCLEIHPLPLNPNAPAPLVVPLPQRVCSISPGANQDFEGSTFRLTVHSPNMPPATFDCDLATGRLTLLHQEAILGLSGRASSAASGATEALESKRASSGPSLASVPESSTFGGRPSLGQKLGPLTSGPSPPTLSQNRQAAPSCSGRDTPDSPRRTRGGEADESRGSDGNLTVFTDRYICESIEVASYDNVPVPLSLIAAADTPLDGSRPGLLIGYGAYGCSLEAGWDSERLPLLDRGWVIAYAHVRGGGEKGKQWHAAGSRDKKESSFCDFIACAEYLVGPTGCVHPDKLAASGTSAGGLLVGASVNRRPELFRAVIAKVPFVDVCNTMMDPSLPLTAQEAEEWGDPISDARAFHYIRSYSPYDNIREGVRYPAMFVTASVNDIRVGYWEPTKWVARIREACDYKDPRRPIILKTSMDSGHFGHGGRYMRLVQEAEEIMFLLGAVESK